MKEIKLRKYLSKEKEINLDSNRLKEISIKFNYNI